MTSRNGFGIGSRDFVSQLTEHPRWPHRSRRPRSPGRSKPARCDDGAKGCCEYVVLCRVQLTPPVIDGLCGRFLRGRGAGPAALGEHEQASPRVPRVGLAYDVAALHQMFDELACSLLGGPCAWRLEDPANLQGVAHRPTHEEVILVLEGELQLTLDGVRFELSPGDVAFVPSGTEMRVDAGREGAAAWVTTTPGLEALMADGSRISPPWAM